MTDQFAMCAHQVFAEYCPDCKRENPMPETEPEDPGLIDARQRFQDQGETPEESRFQTMPMHLIEPEETIWLVRGALAEADVTVFVGEEGIGKGLWWINQAREVTNNGHNVLVIASEDDPSRAIRPRLDAAGVDASKIHLIIEDKETLTGHPELPGDTGHVQAMIEELDAKLLILDPWSSVVPHRLSLKDPQQARKALDPLLRLARRTRVAILVVVHTNRTSGSTRDRVGLSSVLRQVARILLLALEDPEDDTSILIGIDKANGLPRGPATRYTKSGTGSRWKVEVEEDDTGRTIREWAESFQISNDGRGSNKWTQIKELAEEQGVVTRAQIVDVYDGKEGSADKAIGRWKQAGRLVVTSTGTYSVVGI